MVFLAGMVAGAALTLAVLLADMALGWLRAKRLLREMSGDRG